MFEFDQHTWLYLGAIAIFFLFFRWNSRRAKQKRNDRKNRNFRRRYEERKRENEKAKEELHEKHSGK